MKLSGREAARFCTAPDKAIASVLIYGEDGFEVASRRETLSKAWLGKGAKDGLVRLSGAEQRRDPARVTDALKSKGFFDEQRIVWIEDATDGCAKGLEDSLASAIAGEAYLVVTAGILPARSKLRKLFEAAKSAASVPCYGDALGRDDIQGMLAERGAANISNDALASLTAMARSMDRGAMSDLIERLSLYCLGQTSEISDHDVEQCAPGQGDAAIDDIVDIVMQGKAGALGPSLAKVQAQGVTGVSVILAILRRLRQMQTLLAGGDRDLDAAIGRLRPPVFGPRRDALLRNCRSWGLARTEGALQHIHETDASLRGGAGAQAPFATVERALLRLAVSAPR